MDNLTQNISLSKTKIKFGRWNEEEIQLFEELIEKYGSNWKKIQEHMKYRNLTQIRSHAQKYFRKKGKAKFQELRNKAKILQAYHVLQQQSTRLKIQTQIKEQKLQSSLQVNSSNEQQQRQLFAEKEKINNLSISQDNIIPNSIHVIKEQQQQAPIKEQQTPIREINNLNLPYQINQNHMPWNPFYSYYTHFIDNTNMYFYHPNHPNQIIYHRF